MLKHQIEKIKREPLRRKLTVVSRQFLTPRMLRIQFHSDELEGFESPSPDDHIKIFLPISDAGAEESFAKRDFTPRSWDCTSGSFTLDFSLHEHGAAADWARGARAGDVLEIGGPRGSLLVPDDFDWYVLVGDACAIPSFSRRLERLRAGVPVQTILLVAGEEEHQTFVTAAGNEVRWLSSGATSAEESATLLAALKRTPLPPGDGFIWIAAETEVARDLYRYFVDQCAQPAAWIKASAYWSRT